jgi:hypothetical protein
MTMQHESHPHDERLAALAGADREATDDRALRDHVAACAQCRAVVDDLTHLRTALAELPDLQPSRPLQLLPPLAAPAAPRTGVLGVLKRLSAPALGAGVVLILVGAVGGSGILGGFAMGGAASAPDYQEVSEDLSSAPAPAAEATDSLSLGSDNSEGFASGATPSARTAQEPGQLSGSAKAQSAVPRPTDGDENGRQELTGSPTGGPTIWIVMLGVGAVLAVGSLLVRATAQPRAG